MCVCGGPFKLNGTQNIVKYHSRTQNIEPYKGIVGAVRRRCVYFGVRWACGKGGGYRYQITTCACLVI